MLNVSVLVKDIDSPMGKYLICRTKDGKWTFPQSLVRTTETVDEAAKRTCYQQLGIEVKPDKEQVHTHRKVPEYHIEHTYVEAFAMWTKTPQKGTFDELRWVRACELRDYEFEDYDARVMSKFIPWINADGSEIPGTRMH